jgi:hypothetical protein
MVPVSPILYLFYMETLFQLFGYPKKPTDPVEGRNSRLRETVLILMILVIINVWWLTGTVFQKNYWMKRGFNLARYQETLRKEVLIPVARWLLDDGGEDSLIAVGWAGTIPYFSGLRTIGLTCSALMTFISLTGNCRGMKDFSDTRNTILSMS